MAITPSSSLMYCPVCGEPLHIEKMFSEKDSLCIKCDYKEPAGSAHFVTFTSEVLSNFLKNLNVKKISIADVETNNFSGVLDSLSVLPALLVNARLNTKHIGSDFNNLPLTTIEDKEGYYHRRVITTTSNITNPALIFSALAETLYTSYLLSMENEKNKLHGILDLNYISPISANKNSNIEHFAANESIMASSTEKQEAHYEQK